MFWTRRVVRSAATGRPLIGWPVQCWRSLTTADVTPQGTSSAKPVKGSVDKGYTPQEREVILRLLNTATESQLDCVVELQGKKATSIVQYRDQHGPFSDLNTLRKLQSFQPSFIHRLCDSMLSLSARNHRHMVARFLRPDITLSRLQAAESIVSIVFGLKKMAWAHIDCTMTVREWQQRECFYFTKGKHMPEMYLEDISSVVSSLPPADYYILEKPSLSPQKSSLFPVLSHMRTVEAMLFCLLNPQILEKKEHRVFSMNRNTVGKHFEIMLGESRTSGVEIVHRLINEVATAARPRVNFTPELVQQYLHQYQARGQHRNEELCDALLQAITFYELALF